MKEYNTVQSWLEDYANGVKVPSVEMGGLGDGYEMGIQTFAITMMFALLGLHPEEHIRNLFLSEEGMEDYRGLLDCAENIALEKSMHDGLTGVMVGAAKNIVSVFFRHTPQVGIDMAREKAPSRIIEIPL